MIDNGGPAHPVFVVSASADDEELNAMTRQLERLAPGVSVRDYFAARAPQMSKFWWDENKAQFESLDEGEIAWRWHYADAMLAQRAKKKGEG